MVLKRLFCILMGFLTIITMKHNININKKDEIYFIVNFGVVNKIISFK